MISKSISTSKKLAKVSVFEALLFTWLIPHCDDYGRMDGNARIVKGIVMPLREDPVEEIEKALKALHKIGLISRYVVESEEYLEVFKWEEHQTFKTDRARIAKYPPLPGGNQLETLSAQDKISEVKLSEEKLRKDLFEKFYESYPRKIAKKKAELSWKKISLDLFDGIIRALEQHKVSDQWVKDAGKYIPYPATWLNQERWNDVLKVTTKNTGKYDGVKSTKA